MAALFFIAAGRDIQNETNEAQTIINFASRIAAEKVPPNPRNAARVFMHFVGGYPASQMAWMTAFDEVG